MLLLPSTINQTVGVTGDVLCIPDAQVTVAPEPPTLGPVLMVEPEPAAEETVIKPLGPGFAVVPTLAVAPLPAEPAREPVVSVALLLHAASINPTPSSAHMHQSARCRPHPSGVLV